MALKLKLKVGGSSSPGNNSAGGTPRPATSESPAPLPKLKIKPPKPNKIDKPEHKDKLKKLTINFGPKKSQNLDNLSIEGITQPVKKIPKVRVKPTRVPGDGYDSETPDMEDDPLIENGIVVRFVKDTNLSFVQNAVESNDLSGINVKWITKDKALVNVNGTIYAGRLIDLPTVTEVFKTVDKKNIFKVLDLCQILLVIKQVNPKELSMEHDFDVPKEYLYTHPIYDTIPHNELKTQRPVMKDGLIYPFEDVWRRFKPRKLNHRILDDIESRVDELIQLDNDAEESHFEFIDRNAPSSAQRAAAYRANSASPPPLTPGGTSMQTDLIEQDLGLGSEDEASDLEEELAKAFETNAGVIDADNNEMIVGESVPDDLEDDEGSVVEAEDDENEDDDEDDDDDDEDDDDNEDDDDHKAEKQHVRMLEEEIADLEKAVESHRAGLANATHKMMKMKFQSSYNTLKASLDSKKRELTRLKEAENKSGEPQKPVEEEEEDEDEDEDDDEDEEDDDEHNDGKSADKNDEDEFDDMDDLF